MIGMVPVIAALVRRAVVRLRPGAAMRRAIPDVLPLVAVLWRLPVVRRLALLIRAPGAAPASTPASSASAPRLVPIVRRLSVRSVGTVIRLGLRRLVRDGVAHGAEGTQWRRGSRRSAAC